MALFAPGSSPAEPYRERALGIEGIKPSWPPLSEVWAQGAEPPPTCRDQTAWAEAHAFLDDLFVQSMIR